MKESEWPYAIAHSYEFMGKTHHMRIDEAMAIGRSGRSGTVQEYALEPGQYLHRTGATIAAKVPAIHKIGRLLTCSDSVCKTSAIERLKPGEL